MRASQRDAAGTKRGAECACLDSAVACDSRVVLLLVTRAITDAGFTYKTLVVVRYDAYKKVERMERKGTIERRSASAKIIAPQQRSVREERRGSCLHDERRG